jgi:hypothetical protein
VLCVAGSHRRSCAAPTWRYYQRTRQSCSPRRRRNPARSRRLLWRPRWHRRSMHQRGLSGGRARLGYPNAVVSARHKSVLLSLLLLRKPMCSWLDVSATNGRAAILSTVVSGPATPQHQHESAATTIQINAGTAVAVHRPSASSTLATRTKGQRSKDEHSPTVGRLAVRSGVFMPDAALSTTNRTWWQDETGKVELGSRCCDRDCRRALRALRHRWVSYAPALSCRLRSRSAAGGGCL